MPLKKALQLKHFVKMESLAMKEDHLLAIYGEIFVIVLNVEKKKPMMMTIQKEGRKKLLVLYFLCNWLIF